MQFQDDWPGLFLRGDEAVVPMTRIRLLAERLRGNEPAVVTSAMEHLSRLADLIDRMRPNIS